MLQLVFGALLAVLAGFVLIAMSQAKRFSGALEQVPKEHFPMRSLLPVGLFALQILPSGMRGNLSRGVSETVRKRLAWLYGNQSVKLFVMIYLADCITYLVVFALFGCLLAIGTLDVTAFVLVMSLAVAMVVVLLPRRLEDQIAERQRSIKLEFPDFLSKFILLLGANMTVQEAWSTASQVEEISTPLYRELDVVNHQMSDLGMPVADALTGFATRCRDADISRFVTSVNQNIKYGGGEPANMPMQQSDDAWKSRKQEALRLGEQASSKLTFPMLLMFLAILLLVMAPALMTISMGFSL